MPVFIDNVAFYPELSAEAVDWSLFNVGDKVRCEIDFNVKTFALGEVRVRPSTGYVGDYWIVSDDALFTDFRVGDSFALVKDSGSVSTITDGTYTIIEKLSDSEIRVLTSPATSEDQGPIYCEFYVLTPITGLKYFYNLIENNEAPNYLSKIDGSQQLYIHKSIDGDVLTASDLIPQGNKSWQIGNSTIQGLGNDIAAPFAQNFRIKHYFEVTPLFLAGQWDDLKLGISPAYFNNGNSLKYIFRIEAMYDFNNPNEFQYIEVNDKLGNAGWFNENFNANPSNYSIDSVVFKNDLAEVIDAVELTIHETTVTIVIKNTVDAPFVNNSTKFVLNFCKAPEVEAEYINGKTVAQNFLFDRKLQTVGSASVNGDNYGTDYQVLKDVTAVRDSASQITITAKIALDQSIVDDLNLLDVRRYLIWVSIQDHTLATNVSDKVSLLVDADDFFQDTTDDGLVTQSTLFLRHPDNNPDIEGVITLDAFPNDEIVAITQFYIDKSALITGDTVSIQKSEMIVKAKNSVTGDEFILESFSYDFSALPIISGNQFVNVLIDRNFHIPTTEPRRNVKIKRRLDLDNADKYYYDIYFPFVFRWEYWTVLPGVNSDFFDTLEPKNGFNNEWQRFNTVANWGIYYENSIYVKKNKVVNKYKDETELGASDYSANPDYDVTLLSFDDATNTALLSGGKNYIQGYTATRIEAEFTKISAVPDLANIAVVFCIEFFEKGSPATYRRYSSSWETIDTWFSSINGDNKIKLTLIGNTVKAEALIDFSKIPLTEPKFSITARIYDYDYAAPFAVKITEDGQFKITETGDFKIIE